MKRDTSVYRVWEEKIMLYFIMLKYMESDGYGP